MAKRDGIMASVKRFETQELVFEIYGCEKFSREDKEARSIQVHGTTFSRILRISWVCVAVGNDYPSGAGSFHFHRFLY